MVYNGINMTEEEEREKARKEHEVKLRREIRRTHIAIWTLFGLSAVLAAYVYFQTIPPPPHKYDALAKCIANTSTTFYGAWWCPDCAQQKTRFGTGAQYLPYHECANPDRSENDSCKAAGVSRYPTWVFPNGSRLIGVQSPAKLSEETGCPLPTSS